MIQALKVRGMPLEVLATAVLHLDLCAPRRRDASARNRLLKDSRVFFDGHDVEFGAASVPSKVRRVVQVDGVDDVGFCFDVLAMLNPTKSCLPEYNRALKSETLSALVAASIFILLYRASSNFINSAKL